MPAPLAIVATKVVQTKTEGTAAVGAAFISMHGLKMAARYTGKAV